jgi:hypothetical protein
MNPAPKFELSDVRYIKRIVVGSDNPNAMRTEQEIEAATQLLNRCLSEWPKGTILAVEKSFSLLALGEHRVVLQWTVYHVGFQRKPDWLTDVAPAPKPAPPPAPTPAPMPAPTPEPTPAPKPAHRGKHGHHGHA